MIPFTIPTENIKCSEKNKTGNQPKFSEVHSRGFSLELGTSGFFPRKSSDFEKALGHRLIACGFIFAGVLNISVNPVMWEYWKSNEHIVQTCQQPRQSSDTPEGVAESEQGTPPQNSWETESCVNNELLLLKSNEKLESYLFFAFPLGEKI